METAEDNTLVWNTLTSEYLYKQPWLTARKDEVLLPNGHIIPSYYVLEYPNWVNAIGITKQNEMILIRQYRHALGRVSYELCAGVCDDTDNTPLDAAKRELLEETGYGNGNWQEWMVLAPNPATSNNLTYFYLATELELIAPQQLEISEQINVHLFSAAEVKQLLEQGEIIQALHAAPLWKFFSEIKG